MNNRTVVTAVVILLLGLMGLGAWKVLSGWLLAKKENEAKVGQSDAKVKRVIRGAGDGYLGYGYLNSPEMTQQLLSRGLGIKYTNDQGDYAQRLEKLAKGEYDFIVLPVNSFLQHGAKHNYPGRIVASIAESRGADAIVGFKDKLPTGKVTDLNNAALKIVYTKDSPSSFLMDLSIVDFDLFYLTKTDEWRQEVNGIDDVYERIKRRDGDVFVLWESELSRALAANPDLRLIHGSDRFSGYIVDVFVFNREFLRDHEDDVTTFMEAYFSTMSAYKLNRAKFVEDMKDFTNHKLTKEEIEGALEKISFYSLQANCTRQFGLASGLEVNPVKGLTTTILSCKNVLAKCNRLSADALDDPGRIVYPRILQQVQQRLPAELGESAKKWEFSKLADDRWAKLKEVGLLRVDPITFQQGAALLDSDGEARVDEIAKLIATNYPEARVVVRGHTGAGDEDENVRLSRERAETIVQRLTTVHGMSVNRFRAEGKGSSDPPVRRPDENQRAYMYRMARVEFVLFMDN